MPEKDLALFIELIKKFKWKDTLVNSNESIPEWHKAETRRIKESKPKNLLDWNSVKNDF